MTTAEEEHPDASPPGEVPRQALPPGEVPRQASPSGEVPQQASPSGEVPRQREPAADALTDRERDVLAFEKQWWRHAGSKEQAIRDRFALSPTRYYQILNGLLDRPAALAEDPALVQRLRRVRASRSRARRPG